MTVSSGLDDCVTPATIIRLSEQGNLTKCWSTWMNASLPGRDMLNRVYQTHAPRGLHAKILHVSGELWNISVVLLRNKCWNIVSGTVNTIRVSSDLINSLGFQECSKRTRIENAVVTWSIVSYLKLAYFSHFIPFIWIIIFQLEHNSIIFIKLWKRRVKGQINMAIPAELRSYLVLLAPAIG